MVTVLPVVVLSVVPVVVEADVVEPDVAVVVVPDDRRTTDNDSHLLAHNFTLALTKPQLSHTQSTQSTQSCELSVSFLCEDCSSKVLEAKTLTELREDSVSDSLLSHLRGSRRRVDRFARGLVVCYTSRPFRRRPRPNEQLSQEVPLRKTIRRRKKDGGQDAEEEEEEGEEELTSTTTPQKQTDKRRHETSTSPAFETGRKCQKSRFCVDAYRT